MINPPSSTRKKTFFFSKKRLQVNIYAVLIKDSINKLRKQELS